ncbi:MAG: C-type lectin domain-containing protein, partial [Phycisphaerae bacterium]
MDKCFKVVHSPTATWAAAKSACALDQAHLATIESDAELIRLTPSLVGTNRYWIGLNDQSVEGSFVWDSGSASTFRKWKSGQPDNSGGTEDCGDLTVVGGIWLMNDNVCWRVSNYICSFTPTSVVSSSISSFS